MRNTFKLLLVPLLLSLTSVMAFAVNADDPNLRQNAGGNALVSGAVIPGINPCEPTKECTGSFQSGSREGNDWSRLLPDGDGNSQVLPSGDKGIGE
jgi:hypothetical protein